MKRKTQLAICRIRKTLKPVFLICVAMAFTVPVVAAEDTEKPQFFRGLNLNGPAVVIDGRQWAGMDSPDYVCRDKAFENQDVPLVPATDPQRAKMIRSSRWGGNRVELTSVPGGLYTVFLYVWEDNAPETFSISLNDRVVVPRHNSGRAGNWERLGPWPVEVGDGVIRLTSQGGAANFSGIEVWRGRYDGADSEPINPDDLGFFEKRIRPLLAAKCYECHASDAKEIQGGLLVDSRPAMRRGGDNGPAVVPGDVEASLLIRAVRYADDDLQMPPKEKLSDEEIADLERWVRLGAPDPRVRAVRVERPKIDVAAARQFWSLQPIADPPPPTVRDETWPTNEIDRFILARLEPDGLTPAADADRRVLIRRVTYDLIGLPPTPEEIAAFAADPAPDAFARLIDRLLASPHYGERWGRHWLDVVRYADTAGDNSDFPIPQMFGYRNWVIEAINRDLPFDRFVLEQIAGDLLPDDSTAEKAAADVSESRRQRIIATGYLANARRFGSRVDDYPQHLTIEDTIDNLGRAFLGLSLNCARCHDHKFDPLTVEDYYAIYGILHSTRYPWPGIELEQKQRDLVPLAAAAGPESSLPMPVDLAYAVAEAGKIEDAAVQIKGDPAKQGPLVPRRFLAVLGGAGLPETEAGSGRRQLAEWIAAKENPLTARVLVNRLWLHHFGCGLVPTPNDFGKQGKPPSHPELLDWLASRLIDSGWSIKAMQREILLSRTYQQASGGGPASPADPGLEKLSRYPRRRLDAEAIRDTLLDLGGNLDRTPGGPHPFPPPSEWKFTQHKPFKAVYETNRRSVYLMTQRIQRHPYMAIFDGPDPSASIGSRLTSTTPLQALFLLNDPFVHDQAQQFAQRLLAESGDDRERIDRAMQLALGRAATTVEIDEGQQFLATVAEQLRADGLPPDQLPMQVWATFARALFRLNEFVYVD